MQAIILAGGFGTRLQAVVKDVPKPMALINDKPFLHFIFNYLKEQGIKEVILALSYKAFVIEQYFKDEYLGIKIAYSIEKEPLGTGGAIKQALTMLKKDCFVLNGDTFFPINLSLLKLENSKLCLALKKMYDFDRYGTILLDEKGFVSEFKEKAYTKEGLINGGIYRISKDIFKGFALEQKFSFEDFLQENAKALNIRAEIFDEYFIDIGIPKDYSQFIKDMQG